MSGMNVQVLNVEIRYEHDVVMARQRARQIAELLGFDHLQQVQVATAVSEIARNAFQYASRGKVEFALVNVRDPTLQITVTDHGPGIPNLRLIQDGNYKSKTGMGL